MSGFGIQGPAIANSEFVLIAIRSMPLNLGGESGPWLQRLARQWTLRIVRATFRQ